MGLPGALAGVSAVGSIIDTVGKLRNEEAQEDFIKDRYKATRSTAIKTFLNSVDEVRVGTLQERQQIATEIENIATEAITARGSAAAAASTAGVSGVSVGDVQMDIATSEQVVKGRLDKLQSFREAAAELRVRGLARQTQNRILVGLPGPFVKSNVFGEILGIGTDALAGFGAGQDLSQAL